MKFSVTVSTLLIAVALMAMPVVAQTPERPTSDGHRWSQPGPVGPNETADDIGPMNPTVPVRDGLGPSTPSAAVGEPGMSLRYVRTFGESTVPYPADTQHLNKPDGMYVDASGNVFVTEEASRVLKYTPAGAHALTIGVAGQPWHHGQFVHFPNDLTVDGTGNIWVVMDHAIKQFAAAGVDLQWLPRDDPWVAGSDNSHFNQPHGVAVDSAGRLFVSDTNNHRIQVYSMASGSPVYLATLGVTGVPGSDNGHFNLPYRIAIDNGDHLYVADLQNARVQRCTYSSAWSCATFHGTGSPGSGSNELNNPHGIAVDPAGNVYIADTGNGRIKKCTSSGACTVFATGFSWVTDVAVAPSGTVYVADWAEHTVHKYASNGTAQGVFAGVPGVPYLTDGAHYYNPQGTAVADNGAIYLTEQEGFRLLKVSAAGQLVWAVGQPGVYGSDNGHLGSYWSGPEGNPAIDQAGRVYVPDTGNNRIQVFTSSGAYHSTFGSSGSGNNQFSCPAGVVIKPSNGDIYVSDRCNQRIQVYNSAWVHKLTIGVTGEPGSDIRHFNWLHGLALDRSGVLYVADTDNHRVQRCVISGASYVCTTFAGQTGVAGNAFGQLNMPNSVVVDAIGRVYVADAGNNRVQVFDSTGRYLTSIGGAWGPSNGQFTWAASLALDRNNNLYVADGSNHRIQKYALGVPDSVQTNIDGFGDWHNSFVTSLVGFSSRLYAGTYNAAGAQLWRQNRNRSWTSVSTDGFGEPTNVGINDLIEFGGQLYAGTWTSDPMSQTDPGGQVWRSSDGNTWTRVVDSGFGDVINSEVFRFVVYNGQLYASTWNWDDVAQMSHGVEIWRTNTGNQGDWARVVDGGFGDVGNLAVPGFVVYDGHLYAGTYNSQTGGEVWRSSDGATWSQINTDGFGDSHHYAVGALVSFGDYLYAGTRYWPDTGGQIWRCQTCDSSDWVKVVDNGFGNPDARNLSALEVVGDTLYVVVGNGSTGLEVWRTRNGVDWRQIGFAGFGDVNNGGPYWDNSVTVFNNALYVGTGNSINGGEVWERLDESTYLPLLVRH